MSKHPFAPGAVERHERQEPWRLYIRAAVRWGIASALAACAAVYMVVKGGL